MINTHPFDGVTTLRNKRIKRLVADAESEPEVRVGRNLADPWLIVALPHAA